MYRRVAPHLRVKEIALDSGNAKSDSGDDRQATLAVYSYNSLAKTCAQHLFGTFILSLAATIPKVEGQTTISKQGSVEDDSFDVRLQNSSLAELAQSVHQTGLSTLEESYLAIIPGLSLRGKLPNVEILIKLGQ